MSYYYK